MGGRLRSARCRLSAADGVTLSEMLVVLLIIMIILGALTTLLVSASLSQVDQTNRVEAQRNARLALDSLRREIRCASDANLVSSSTLVITLPGYCQRPPAASAAQFTWCAKGTAAPYALWRYLGASYLGSTCAGPGRRYVDHLASNVVFGYSRVTILNQPTLTSSTTGGTIKAGTYVYNVTAVDAAGKETSGTNKTITFASATETNSVTVCWTVPACWSTPLTFVPVSYRVYGRDDGTTTNEGMRLIATVAHPTTTYVDTGGAFSSMAAPPLSTVSISLLVDVSPQSGSQRFRLSDDVVLRNSGRR